MPRRRPPRGAAFPRCGPSAPAAQCRAAGQVPCRRAGAGPPLTGRIQRPGVPALRPSRWTLVESGAAPHHPVRPQGPDHGRNMGVTALPAAFTTAGTPNGADPLSPAVPGDFRAAPEAVPRAAVNMPETCLTRDLHGVAFPLTSLQRTALFFETPSGKDGLRTGDRWRSVPALQSTGEGTRTWNSLRETSG